MKRVTALALSVLLMGEVGTAVVAEGGGSLTGPWVHEHGIVGVTDYWYDGADMGVFEGDHGTFDLTKWSTFPEYINDPYYWFDLPDIVPPGEVSFRIRFRGGPIPRSLPIPYDAQQVHVLLSMDRGTIDNSAETGISLYTGSGYGVDGGHQNSLYGYPWYDGSGTWIEDYEHFDTDDQNPMFENIWDRWLNVRMVFSADGLTEHVILFMEDDPGNVKQMWVVINNPLYPLFNPNNEFATPRAQAFGFQTTGLGSAITDPNDHLYIDIEDLLVWPGGLIETSVAQGVGG